MLRLVAIVLVAAACGSPSSHADATGPDGAGADGRLEGPGLTGVLLGPSGEPIDDVMVLACMATVCLFGESDATGAFSFAIEPGALVALKTHEDLTKAPRWGAALEPVRIVEGAPVDVGVLYIPDLPPGTVVGPVEDDPQTLPAGDGLELTLRRAELTVALGEFLDDVAARAIPAAHVPAYAELDGEEVLGVYVLHPFAATSATPIAVRAPSDVAPGTAVRFRTISEIDGSLSPPVTGQADGTAVTTDPGVGITRLTYVVISR